MNGLSYIDGIRSLSSIYSAPFLRNILIHDKLSLIDKRFVKYKEPVLSQYSITKFNDLLSALYKEMFNNYRNEYLYKNTIINKILLGKYSLQTTTLLNELKIGKSKADILLLNGEVKLYEIKTDLDNLDRLDSQLNDYRKAVEKIYIVTNTKYLEDIKSNYNNEGYGIIEYTDRNTLRIHSEPTENKQYFDHLTIFKLLRKKEYVSIFNKIFGYIPNIPNTLIFKKCLNKFKAIDVVEFQKFAFLEIKKRKLNCPDLLKDKNTPYELRYLCYSLDLNKEQYNKLFKLLNVSI